MNDKPLSQSEYDRLKQQALQNEPVTRKVRLSQIGVTADSLKQNVVTVDGKALSVSNNFINGLCKALSINKGMATDLSETGDGEMLPKMVDAMKSIKSRRVGDAELFMVGNPASGEVTDLLQHPLARIPNAELFRITETMLNKYPSLSLTNVDVNDGGMGVSMNLLSGNDVGFGKLGGKDDETFRFGLNLGNDNGGTSISDFFFRLLCLNGAVDQERSNTFYLKSVQADEINRMFKHIQAAEKRGFVPLAFEDNLKNAARTPASYRETDETVRALLSMMRGDKEDKDEFREKLINEFFRGYREAQAKLIRAGVDPLGISKKQAQFIRTGQTVWDVINSVTWLGSHQTDFPWQNQAKVRMYGGTLFSREADLANIGLLNL